MFSRYIPVIFLFVFGSLAFYSGYRNWREDPFRDAVPREARVVDHRVTIDQQRWNEHEESAAEVATQTELIDSSSGRVGVVTLRDHYSTSEKAWKSANAEPAGAIIPCLVSAGMTAATRPPTFLSGPQFSIVIGVILWGFAIGILLLLNFDAEVRDAAFKAIAPVLFVPLFPAAGVFLACKMWPDEITHIQAANWQAVPFQKLAARTVGSGKHTQHEIAIRYAFGGHTFDSVLTNDLWNLGYQTSGSGPCRVNPEQPWQVRLHWGWRPSVIAGFLFPIPFLSVGLLCLPALLSPVSRFLFRQSGWRGMRAKHRDWTELLNTGFAFLFIGSIVGVFISICCEMWMNDGGMKWFLTVFLIPFVVWAVAAFVSLIKALLKALQS